MNDFNYFQQNQSSNLKSGTDKTNTKILISFGLFLVGIIGLLASIDKLPTWAIWIIVIYLVIILIKISVNPVKNYVIKIINRNSNNRFAKRMQSEILAFTIELNELIDSQRITTIPYFITHLSSKLPNDVHTLNCLHRNGQQFTILQSWASSLVDNFKFNNKGFLRNAAQLSNIISWVSWACVWAREVLNNTEVQEYLPKDVILDWNNAAKKISDFISRAERMMKSINRQYKTSICTISFQDVKSL